MVLVPDDMMMKVARNEKSFVFCVTAHNHRFSVSLLAQNLYMSGMFARTNSLNCHYVSLFHNVRDSRQVLSFGSQVFSLKLKSFKVDYEKATSTPYGYLVVDISINIEYNYRLHTHILPNEGTIV